MLQLQQRARSLHIEIFRLFSFANIFLITKASFPIKNRWDTFLFKYFFNGSIDNRLLSPPAIKKIFLSLKNC